MASARLAPALALFLAPLFVPAIAPAQEAGREAGPEAAVELPEPLFSVEGISEYRLDNGLRVALFPDPSKDKVTVNVTYMVGSRHEGRGEKGMAHLLEHMVFKGTDTHDDIWGLLEDHGARFNGTTWLDRTNYYETMPATDENLEFALRMEADRMVASRIAAEDLATEFSVVRNEFEMGENDPVGVLMERLVSTAYLWHNYGFSTIGNRSDIERVPVERLRAFYERYYQPDNALLVVAGKFDPARTLALIEETFGAIPRPTRVLQDTYTAEPVQDGARFVSLRRVASNQACGAVYHVPAASHPDAAPLAVLLDLLTSEPSGPVYRALVPDLASGVFSFAFPTREPGLALVMALCRTDQDVRAAHDRMLETVEGLAAEGLGDEEVLRSRTKLLNDIKLSFRDVGRLGVSLSEWQALGDWRMLFVFRDRLREVTTADVQRVAAAYFVESNRTSGVFEPSEEPLRAEIPETPDVLALVDGYESSEALSMGEVFDPSPENVEARTRRLTVGDGIQLAILSKETRGDSVVASLALQFGTEERLTGHEAALDMIPELLMRGTERLDHQALQDAIDALESRIRVSAQGPGTVRATIVSDRAHLGQALELLAEVLRRPAFPEEEFEIVRKQLLAGLETQLTDPQALVFNRLTRLLHPFPEGSIHYVPTPAEELERARAVELADLVRLHAELYGADHAQVAIVGDFDEQAAIEVLERTLGDWKSPAEYARIERPFLPIAAGDETIVTPDKQMAIVARGTALRMTDDDPDFPALELANFILGQSTRSRLLTSLRHEGGLSYGAHSVLQVDADEDGAALFGFAICAPENAGQAQAKIREEFRRWIEEGVGAEELAEGRQGYTLAFDGRMADDGFVARQLLDGLEHGRTFEYHRGLLEAVGRLTPEDVTRGLEAHLKEASFVDVKGGDLEPSEGP